LRSVEERKIQRYEKMRRLCSQLNRSRRQLNRKVNLLCGDLVASNKELSDTVQQLRQAYQFQSGLIGEYDRNYLLCRSLQQIREQLPRSGAAIYLCQTEAFEAHLTAAENPDEDSDGIEMTLYNAVIRHIIRDGKSRVISGVKRRYAGDEAVGEHPDLAVLGIPLIDGPEVIGVMSFYRTADNRFDENDRRKVQPFILPLSRAIAGLQKLESYMGSLKS
jgi:GAF domain-containing protein